MSTNSNMKPWCKVCKDAGKSEVGHWPKDKAGVTICPTLLAQNCRYCLKAGHTVKYCQVLADKKKQDEKRMKDSARQVKQAEAKKAEAKTKKAPVNVFASLEEYSSDEEDEVKPVKEEFPKLSLSVLKETQHNKKESYASALKKVTYAPCPIMDKLLAVAKDEKVDVPEGYQVLVSEVVPYDKREARAKHNQDCFQRKNGLSWADAIDSDDDE